MSNDYGVDTSICSSCDKPMDREAKGLIVFCKSCKGAFQKKLIKKQQKEKLQELAELIDLEKELE